MIPKLKGNVYSSYHIKQIKQILLPYKPIIDTTTFRLTLNGQAWIGFKTLIEDTYVNNKFICSH